MVGLFLLSVSLLRTSSSFSFLVQKSDTGICRTGKLSLSTLDFSWWDWTNSRSRIQLCWEEGRDPYCFSASPPEDGQKGKRDLGQRWIQKWAIRGRIVNMSMVFTRKKKKRGICG